jgi:hypothetical protein
MAYLPCAAHNIQLVIKDGITSDEKYVQLIDRVSRNIVSKSKFSALIAEELRNFDLKFAKKVVTRWNSILFMCRSVLKVSDVQLAKIRKKMADNTQSEKTTKANFSISGIEREMIKELVTILQWFEFATDEFQSNRVNISRVYPCIKFIENKLSEDNDYNFSFTNTIRLELRKSLNKRFLNHVSFKDDLFVLF